VSADPTDPANTRKLVFDASNFSTPQTVTVKGADDTLADGDISYSVTFKPAVSTDVRYAGMIAPAAVIKNLDNESGISVTAAASLTTTEAGGAAQFSVKLERRPTGNVTIALESSDPTEGTVSPTTLTFTPIDWAANQTVFITGVDDAQVDGNVAYSIILKPAGEQRHLLQRKSRPTSLRDEYRQRLCRMKRRPALVTRLWRKLFPARKAVAAKPPQPVRRPVSSLEPLEGRIAPATLISATTLSYQDLDGDTVTVKFSKPIFDLSSPGTGNTQANAIFSFTGGNGVDGNNTTPQSLNLIDLTKAPLKSAANVAAGISFTITAKSASGSASTVDIGKVKADGLALGAVRIDGALTEIDCGSNSVAVGLKSLTVQSLTSTAGGAKSEITGGLGSLKVQNDFSQAHLQVVNGALVLGKVTAIGKIGSISIGGSVIGKVGDTVVNGTNYANWGLIDAAGRDRFREDRLDVRTGNQGRHRHELRRHHQRRRHRLGNDLGLHHRQHGNQERDNSGRWQSRRDQAR
jgi:hypothetical protein